MSSVSKFGNYAFANCSNLTSVYFSTRKNWKYSYTENSETIYQNVSYYDINNPTRLVQILRTNNGQIFNMAEN